MKISKGVIAAAGLGSRFLPYVKAVTKNLVPILNKPQIQYIVEEFLGAGINQIAIVHNPGDPSIKRYFTPDAELEKKLKESGKENLLESLKKIWQQVKVFKFYPQPRTRLPYGSVTPVLVTKAFIGNQPFVYAFGDDLTIEESPGKYLSHLIHTFEKYQAAAVIATQKVPWEEIGRYGCMKYAHNPHCPNQVNEIAEKLPAEKAYSNFARGGRYIYSTKIFKILANLPIRQGELWMADADNLLAKKELVIAEPLKNAVWMTSGDPQRWLMANIAMAWKIPELKVVIKKFLSTLS